MSDDYSDVFVVAPDVVQSSEFEEQRADFEGLLGGFVTSLETYVNYAVSSIDNHGRLNLNDPHLNMLQRGMKETENKSAPFSLENNECISTTLTS